MAKLKAGDFQNLDVERS
ncbi:hypothetical protein [Pseudanabaena sp. ABRG5-3]|nr:hypothetical protein [Pseudanabaena sp. ABRG5-3]